MGRRRRQPEKSYYEPVREFLRSKMDCIVESYNRDGTPRKFIGRGLGGLIVDVFGLRGVKETGSRALEGIAVEVKRSSKRTSLRNLVQTNQYAQMAHRCYLAQPRRFDQKTRVEASRRGVGLLQINKNGIRVISESRRFSPDSEILEMFIHKSLRIVRCAFCSCYLFRYKSGSVGVAIDGHWSRDQIAPIGKGKRFNKKMYLCTKCEDLLSEVTGSVRLKRSVNLLERRVQTLQRKLKRI